MGRWSILRPYINKRGRIRNHLAPPGRNARKGPRIVFGPRIIPTPQGGYPIRRIRRQSGDGGVIDKVGWFRADPPPSKSGNSKRAIRREGPVLDRGEYRRPKWGPLRWAPDLWGATYAGISNRIALIYC